MFESLSTDFLVQLEIMQHIRKCKITHYSIFWDWMCFQKNNILSRGENILKLYKWSISIFFFFSYTQQNAPVWSLWLQSACKCTYFHRAECVFWSNLIKEKAHNRSSSNFSRANRARTERSWNNRIWSCRIRRSFNFCCWSAKQIVSVDYDPQKFRACTSNTANRIVRRANH